MKKVLTLLLAVVMLAVCLTGCGAAKEKTADLEAFYQSLDDKYDWGDSMIDLTDDLLDSYYPGLKDLASGKLVAKMPLMSSVVNEIVLVECATEEDAAKAAEIFQKRIDDQAAGGAWYPDSMEAWGNGQVYTEGKYAAMIASAEHQDEIGEAFTALFA
ncbi:MAG: DUF4358 domain-containing protein [Oscillibacter sp.]|jgi:predicted small lipoprotein YifL|nr:DUF4358 domain-containing protein [Oscillibacter sp.]